MKALASAAIVISLMAFAGGGLVAQSGNDLFQQALVKERTAGDLNAAIALYQTIVQKHGTDRALVAKALVQLGGCYERLGTGDASASYERVVREFGDQKESVGTARARLAALRPLTTVAGGQVARLIWNDVDEREYGPLGLSGDGRYMSFSDSNSLDLVVRDLKEGTTRHLTNTKEVQATGSDDYAAESLVSPDGRRVAYSWEITEGEFRDSYDLRILPLGPSPGEPRIVHRSKETDYIWPADWSPDGKSLLVGRRLKDRTYQIAIVSIADASLRVLKSIAWTGPGRATWSPDGRSIVYAARGERDALGSDIFLVAAEGTREARVVQHPANDGQPVWSPDGSQLLFVSDRTGNDALWAVPMDAGRAAGPPALIKSDIGRLLGMTRGGALYYVTGGPTTNIYAVDVDTSMKVKGAPVLATGRFINSNVAPVTSPDGHYLAYRREGSSPRPAIIVIRSEAGEERELRLDLASVEGPMDWFPDGRSLLVKSRDLQGDGTGFYRVETESGKAALVLHVRTPVPSVDLSPDGRSIFYVGKGRDSSPAKLMRFDLESGREAEFPEQGGLVGITSLAVSPDGAQLAFSRARGLQIVSVSGGPPRVVFRYAGTVPARIQLSAWTPDQNSLLCVVDDGAGGKTVVGGQDTVQELWRVPLAGGTPERLGISVKGSLSLARLDPGGRRIIYQAIEERPSELWALENFLPQRRASK